MKVIHITRTCPDVQVVYVYETHGQAIYLIAVKVIYSMFINIQTEYSTAYILRRDLRDPCMPFADACSADKPSGDKRARHDNVSTTAPWHKTLKEFSYCLLKRIPVMIVRGNGNRVSALMNDMCHQINQVEMPQLYLYNNV
jgi:hypothetical protein